MKYAKVLINCPMGRFKKGEIGLIMPNKFEKYDVFLDLGTQYTVLFGKIFLAGRQYYFRNNEVDLL